MVNPARRERSVAKSMVSVWPREKCGVGQSRRRREGLRGGRRASEPEERRPERKQRRAGSPQHLRFQGRDCMLCKGEFGDASNMAT